MIDHTSTFYAKKSTELSWLIGSGVVCYKNQMGQQHNRSDRVPTLTKKKKLGQLCDISCKCCDLRRK